MQSVAQLRSSLCEHGDALHKAAGQVEGQMGSCSRLILHDLCIKVALKLERQLAQLKHANLQGEQVRV